MQIHRMIFTDLLVVFHHLNRMPAHIVQLAEMRDLNLGNPVLN